MGKEITSTVLSDTRIRLICTFFHEIYLGMCIFVFLLSVLLLRVCPIIGRELSWQSILAAFRLYFLCLCMSMSIISSVVNHTFKMVSVENWNHEILVLYEIPKKATTTKIITPNVRKKSGYRVRLYLCR